MKKSYRDQRSEWKPRNTRGGRGDRKFGQRDSFGEGRGMMHDAVCAGCGVDCQVPFRPNGRKPVYCNNCFKKDNGSEMNFSKSYGKERSSSSDNNISQQLQAINDKLDAIMDALNDE